VTGEPVPNRVAGYEIPDSFIEATTPGQTNWRAAPAFDPQLYLLANPDVAAAGVDPEQHYLEHGKREKRRLRP
jgi:chondroitin 4-sulfotransferase 11